MDKLTTKQRLFVEAYLANPNATDAARKAGYRGSENALAVVGNKLLRNSKIAALMENRVQTAIITTNEILEGVKAIALNGDKDSDKLKAYELLGKHLAMWTDTTRVDGGLRIEVVYDDAGSL